MSAAGPSAAMPAGCLPADWPAPPGILAFTTLRGPIGASRPPFDRFNLGTRCGDDPAAVAHNRDILCAGLPAPPRWLHQVHGVEVVLEPGFDQPQADAAVSRQPGCVLAILTADCLPVLFCTEQGDAVAAAHAGWRGLAAGVLERTVAALSATPGSILAWLGPAAGANAYEVGGEVRAAFVDADPATAAAFAATRPGHWHCDLYALARHRLARLGIDRVHGGGRCTISEPMDFFSYRRDRECGRMATVIVRLGG